LLSAWEHAVVNKRRRKKGERTIKPSPREIKARLKLLDKLQEGLDELAAAPYFLDPPRDKWWQHYRGDGSDYKSKIQRFMGAILSGFTK